MIECERCETARFLQITNSRILLSDDGTEVLESTERYECTACGATGKTVSEGDRTRVFGDVRENTDELPKVRS